MTSFLISLILPVKNIEITQHWQDEKEGLSNILGTIKNNSAVTLKFPIVQVDLFNKSGKFIFQCTEYLKGGLLAGQSRNFVVACKNEHDKRVTFDHYKIIALTI